MQSTERRIEDWKNHEAACRKTAAMPGVGILTTVTLIATIGKTTCFKYRRELATFVGLVPR